MSLVSKINYNIFCLTSVSVADRRSDIIYIRPGIRTFFISYRKQSPASRYYIFKVQIYSQFSSLFRVNPKYTLLSKKIFGELWWFWFSWGLWALHERARVNYFASDWSVPVWTSTFSILDPAPGLDWTTETWTRLIRCNKSGVSSFSPWSYLAR